VGNNEEPVSLVAGSNVGCAENPPRSHVPELGKLIEGGSKERSEPCGILKDQPSRSQSSHRIEYVGPEEAVIVGSLSKAGLANRLARRATAQNVDRLDRRPVHRLDVTQVRYTGVVTGQHLAGVFVHLALPRRQGAENSLHGSVETGDSGAYRAIVH
jgi:hypothetical protein